MTAPRGRDGKTFRQVSETLRARLADGTYARGSLLPSQIDLATEFGVSRDTVQQVVQELRSEGWIDTRQGSRARVVKNQHIQSTAARAVRPGRPITLGPLISEAFAQAEVSLDVYTLTSESLDTHIRLQAERIRAGVISPERVSLRVLLPDPSLSLPFPRALDEADNPLLQGRLRAITETHTASLLSVLNQLDVEGFVPSLRCEIRHVPLAPTFKAYLLNGSEVLHGMYEVIERRIVLEDGSAIDAYDVLGVGATLTHHVMDDDPGSPGSVFVSSFATWFESVWERMSEPA